MAQPDATIANAVTSMTASRGRRTTLPILVRMMPPCMGALEPRE
jgi:hypothetical protein